MHFRGSGITHHADDLSAGGAADDGIVDENHALALEQVPHRIEFQAHAEIAHALLRLDECASNVVIADQSKAKRDPALVGIANGGGNARIRHGHDEISIYRSLARELAAQRFAAFLHGTAKDHAVRTRKIYVLEDAARLLSRRRIETRMNAFASDHNQLARLHVALITRANQVKRAAFGCKHRRCVSARIRQNSHRHWTKYLRIARTEHPVA